MAKEKIIIIGGGMAGLIAGIECARHNKHVTLIERNTRVGKKILATGNGRCNISNRYASSNNYHSSTKNIYPYIEKQWGVEDTLDYCKTLGIETIELEKGKIYPLSLQAASVVHNLRLEAEEIGVHMVYDQRVTQVVYNNKFIVHTKDKKYYGDKVIISTGGKSYSDSGSSGDGYTFAKNFGHTIIEPMPSIVQLITDMPYNKHLKGLKVTPKADLIDVTPNYKVNNSINNENKSAEDTLSGRQHNRINEQIQIIKSEFDEVLFTDYGLSGPATLQLSTQVGPLLKAKHKLLVRLDFFPEISESELDSLLLQRFTRFPSRNIQDIFSGLLHQRLVIPVLKLSQVDVNKQAGNITKKERQSIVGILKAFDNKINDTYLWNQAQVTKGGVSCFEVNPTTLESNLLSGLYFCGEVLDIDGDCGGYNLQWAIASGIVVARSII